MTGLIYDVVDDDRRTRNAQKLVCTFAAAVLLIVGILAAVVIGAVVALHVWGFAATVTIGGPVAGAVVSCAWGLLRRSRQI